MKQSFLRLIALIRKETRQLLRDKSNLAVGLILPIILILLFGYGLSFDLTNARVAVVVEQHSPQANTLLSGIQDTKYLKIEQFNSFDAAKRALLKNENDAILTIPPNYAQSLSQGNAHLQLILNGANPSIATALQGYVAGAVSTSLNIQADRHIAVPILGTVSIEQRLWFNESGNSTWFLVPGLIVLILTLIGAFLTALLIAKERERGTLEAIFVTPVRPIELVIAKLVPYIVVGTIDLIICLLAAHFIFDVPIRGSILAVFTASFLYLIVSLALGLAISGIASSQFLASQVALIASFMPALMLSGFVFDTRNLPIFIQIVSQILPATHFMTLIKTLFLAGNDWTLFFKECGILLFYAIFLINASRIFLRKKLR
ncbi:ABC transporter permease [Acinetobacter sp. ANC 4648]|uniref:ABC transporter permease n=1 Tax=Acinetobacter sp. ANC 4648 TaxID=1977875 RepID=UPI000A32CF0A|nr:ABC transporter permease [Acinetobacter sp. ANC 4648]OTG80321.1 hypothetical protein B9T27_13205 [Acinetobacter sp. ANC 4648]